MSALDQHVGRHDGPAVGGGEHGRVVTGSDEHGRGMSTADDEPVDDGELAELGERPRTLLVGHVTPELVS